MTGRTDITNEVRVWENDGSPFDGAWSTYGDQIGDTGNSAYAVAAGDLDHDGHIDVIGGGWDTNIYIFKGNNSPFSGAWTTNRNISASSAGAVNDLAVADIDRDGYLDLVVGFNGTTGAEVIVWENTYDTTAWTFTQRDVDSSSGTVNSVDVGDIDHDGWIDIVQGSIDDEVVVWENTYDATAWTFSEHVAASTLGDNVSAVALADLDNDGYLDIAAGIGATAANEVLTFGNDVNAPFDWSFTQHNTGATSTGILGLAVGDIDRDGDADLATVRGNTTTSGEYEVAVWQNDAVHRNAPFADSGQSLGNSYSFGVALGDVDGDGDLDAFVANENQANRVWLNDGGVQGGTLGVFTDSGQSLGNGSSQSVALGDLDRDGDLDAFVVNVNQPDIVWTNDGSGNFSNSGQSLGTAVSQRVALGDVDGDGDLDAMVTIKSEASRVWMNNGSGTFSSGQSLWDSASVGIALGDIDGDGDLDAFVGNDSNQANRVWTNNGGTFSDSGQLLGGSSSVGVVLRDVDGDGDLDAFVSNFDSQANRVWINDGNGVFTDSGHNLGNFSSVDVALGDVDEDGDLDAFVANYSGQANRVWVNDGGSAQFDVIDTAPGNIADDAEDDVLQIDFTHNGIVADRTLELHSFNLEVYQSDCTTAYNTTDAAAIIDDIYVRLDDGNGTFEGTETAVATVDTLTLTGGVQTVNFTNDDTDVQVSVGGTVSRTYWVSVKTTADASDQTSSGFCIQVDPDAGFVVEGKTPDFSVSLQDTSPTNTGGINNTPTAVRLTSFAATPTENGIEVTWVTATEIDNLGFNLYRAIAPEGPFDKLSDTLIPTQNPGQVLGAAYTWLDESIAHGGTYYYLLEDIDINGVVISHGPVSASMQNPTAVSLTGFDAHGSTLSTLTLFIVIGGVSIRTLKRRKK